jgi:hypothetical protein
MDMKELTSGGRFSGKPVSTGNQQSLLPSDSYTPPYKLGEADPNRLELKEIYLPYGKQHAEKYSIKIAITLKQALEMRQAGMEVLTIREADIAARWQVPLGNHFLYKALSMTGSCFTEGIPGEKDNAYQLRETYNRGVAFKRDFYNKVDRERQIKADQYMVDILAKLEAIDLPAWPEELTRGFAQELCKPEYMNWEQYRAASQGFVFREPDTFKESSDADKNVERV